MSFCSSLISGCGNAISICYEAIGNCCSTACKGLKEGGQWLDDKTFKIFSSANLMFNSACQGEKTEFVLGTVQLIRGVGMAATTVATIALFAGGASFKDVMNGDASLSPAAQYIFTTGIACNAILESATAITSYHMIGTNVSNPKSSIPLRRVFNERTYADIFRLGKGEETDRIFRQQTYISSILGTAYTGVALLTPFVPLGVQGALAGTLFGVKAAKNLLVNHNIPLKADLVMAQRQLAAADHPVESNGVVTSMYEPGEVHQPTTLEDGYIHGQLTLTQTANLYDLYDNNS